MFAVDVHFELGHRRGDVLHGGHQIGGVSERGLEGLRGLHDGRVEARARDVDEAHTLLAIGAEIRSSPMSMGWTGDSSRACARARGSTDRPIAVESMFAVPPG